VALSAHDGMAGVSGALRILATQCEALTMVAVQVFGKGHSVGFAGSQGNFQLNVYKPVILHNLLTSIELVAVRRAHSASVARLGSSRRKDALRSLSTVH
jgi:fumarate hydratase class II